MKQVSEAEFFERIMKDKLDVHPSIQPGPYPYTSVWEFPKQPGKPAYGKSVGRIQGGLLVMDYFVTQPRA